MNPIIPIQLWYLHSEWPRKCFTKGMLPFFDDRLDSDQTQCFGRIRAPLRGGGAIIETIVAMAIAAIFLSGIHLTNSQAMLNVRSSLESIAATRDLTSRAEQVRASTWTQVNTPSFLQNSILSVAPDSGGDLGGLTETIDITAYLAPAGTVAPIKVRRSANGLVGILNAGDGTMQNQTSVRIVLTSDWTGKGGRLRTRQATLIVGQGGILGRS